MFDETDCPSIRADIWGLKSEWLRSVKWPNSWPTLRVYFQYPKDKDGMGLEGFEPPVD